MCYAISDMNTFLLAAVLIAIVPPILPVYGQEKNTEPHADQKRAKPVHDSSSPSFAVGTINQETTEGKSDNPNDHSDSYLHHLLLPETLAAIGLLVAGICGIRVAVRTLKAIERQTRATENQTQLLIEKERSRLVIELDDLIFPDTLESFSKLPVSYRLRNCGSVDAVIMWSECAAVLSMSDSIPKSPSVKWPVTRQVVVTSRETPQTIQSPIISDKPSNVFRTLEDWDAILEDKAFVHFWGEIKYRDAFDIRRKTFRYIGKLKKQWKISQTNWAKCGPPEDNTETKTKS